MCYWKKETALMKMNQILYVIFQTTSQFFFKYCITVQCHDAKLLCSFSAQHYIPWIKKYFKVQISKFLSVPVRFTKFLMSFMKQQFIFQVCINHLYFFSSNVIHFGQKEPIRVQIWDFQELGKNSLNSSSYFSKHKLVQISHNSSVQIFWLLIARMKINRIPYVIFHTMSQFPFNFASPFSVMTQNSSEIFWLKHYKLWTKRAH